MVNVAEIYRRYYKQLIFVPVIVFGVTLLFLPSLKLGIDFTGGISVSFSSKSKVSPDSLADFLKSRLNVSDVSVTPVSGGYIVELSYPPELKKVYNLFNAWTEKRDRSALTELNKLLGGTIRDENSVDIYVTQYADRVKKRIVEIIREKIPDAGNFVVQDIVPVLGAEFWNLMRNVAITAIILLLIAVIFYFRHPVPVLIMLVSGIFDGVAMLSFMGLSNIPLTLSTMAIVLMMVGYSIDTDVVASTFVFKRRKEGDVFKQAERAFFTGATMSVTTLIAMLVIYGVGFLVRNITVIRMANVMIYGVLADLIITWLFNTPVLIWIGEKHAPSA